MSKNNFVHVWPEDWYSKDVLFFPRCCVAVDRSRDESPARMVLALWSERCPVSSPVSVELHPQASAIAVKALRHRCSRLRAYQDLSTYPTTTSTFPRSIQQKPHLLIHNPSHSPRRHLRRPALIHRRPRCLRRP